MNGAETYDVESGSIPCETAVVRTNVLIVEPSFLRARPPPLSTLFPYTTLFRSHPRVDRTGYQAVRAELRVRAGRSLVRDRKSTRLNSSHSQISYAVFCLKKKIRPGDERSRDVRRRIGIDPLRDGSRQDERLDRRTFLSTCPPPPVIYTLSLHDALPISPAG